LESAHGVIHGAEVAVKEKHVALIPPAELASLTVLHLDKDFELIAAVTNQPLERLAE
jgi:hypothetical protein